MKIIECPRDAMQGLTYFIPTAKKIAYINQLLKVGFHTIDFGSFVSPKAIPQMQDTAQVLRGLKLEDSTSKLLAIVANVRGAREAMAFEEIDFLGFPLSLSETFQQKNTNRSIAQALETVEEIQNLCVGHQKQLVTYLSMGFGNPYDDPYDPQVVVQFTNTLAALGLSIISLADTIGVGKPQNISYLFNTLIPEFPDIEFGAHLHSNPASAVEKVAAAFEAGCRRFDGALQGYGGCPMAEDELVGNIPTELLFNYFDGIGADISFQQSALTEALETAEEIFMESH